MGEAVTEAQGNCKQVGITEQSVTILLIRAALDFL